MQASIKFFSVALISICAAAASVASKAETYEGVQYLSSAASRDAVHAEALSATNAPDQNVDAGSRGFGAFTSTADRHAVAYEGVRAANAPDQNVTSGSRVNSKVVSTMTNRFGPRAAVQGIAAK